ncbi:MAG TPA: protein kinase [Myxococcales bacterium LLY-WYZ-16_1]|nr:protein kinase [Myxococcales bacterium LLY-WYZ-16_1]
MAEILRVFDRYEVVRQVASGGMGDLFLARQIGVGGFSRLVVLKSLKVGGDAMLLSQFVNEARAVAKLNHPHVVAVYEIDRWRGVHFIAMEFIRGPNLGAMAKRCRKQGQVVPFRISAAIVRHAALGLLHAHQATDESGQNFGIVHRDISPGNLMVRLDGITKVVDFGIATMKSQLDPREMGVVQGKLRYMAPEQRRGCPPTPAIDQYALGVVLWELLTGRVPEGPGPGPLRAVGVDPRFVPPSRLEPRVPTALEDVALRMLREDPDERYASCREVAEALQLFLQDTGGPAEEQVARFVESSFGADIDLLTRNTTPQPVTIAGLEREVSVRCPGCGILNPTRHRHCFGCGQPLSRSSPRVAPPGISVSRGTEASGRTPSTSQASAGTPRSAHHWLRAVRSALAPERRVQTEMVVVGAPAVLARLLSALGCAENGGKWEEHPSHLRWSLTNPPDLDLGLERALRVAEQLKRLVSEAALGFAIDLNVEGRNEGRALRWAQSALAEGHPDPVVAPEWGGIRMPGVCLEPVLLTGSNSRRAAWTARRDPETASANLLPPYVGREHTLMEVDRSLASVRSEGRAAVHAIGPRGSGRTRWLDEVRRRALAAGFVCVEVHSDELPSLVAGSISHLLEVLNLTVCPEHFEALGMPSHQASTLVEWFERRPDSRNRSCWVRALLEGSKLKPLCILADDIDDSSEEVRRFLEDLVHRVNDGRIFVATTRSGPVQLRGGELASFVRLDPLEDADIAGLVRSVLPKPMTPEAESWLLERARGLPKWAVVWAGFARQRGFLVDSDRGLDLARHQGSFEQEEADALWRRSLLTESPGPLKALLGVAALAGPTFDAPKALSLAGLKDRSLFERMAACGHAAPVSGTRWAFTTPSLREAFASQWTDAERVSIHARWGHLLLAEGKVESAVPHLVEGGCVVEAVCAILESEGSAVTPSDACSLVRAAGRAHDLTNEQRAMFAAWLGECLLDHAPSMAIKAVNAWLPPDGPPVARVRAYRARARGHRRSGQWDEARVDLERALAECDGEGVQGLRAMVLVELSELHEEAGDLNRAAAFQAEALQRGPIDSDPDFAWRQTNGLGRLLLAAGRSEEAAAAFWDAERAAAEAGREVGRIRAASNRAVAWAQVGRVREADTLLEEVSGWADALDDFCEQARVLFNLGRLRASTDRESARQLFEAALDRARRGGWVEGEAMAHRGLDDLGGSAIRAESSEEERHG